MYLVALILLFSSNPTYSKIIDYRSCINFISQTSYLGFSISNKGEIIPNLEEISKIQKGSQHELELIQEFNYNINNKKGLLTYKTIVKSIPNLGFTVSRKGLSQINAFRLENIDILMTIENAICQPQLLTVSYLDSLGKISANYSFRKSVCLSLLEKSKNEKIYDFERLYIINCAKYSFLNANDVRNFLNEGPIIYVPEAKIHKI